MALFNLNRKNKSENSINQKLSYTDGLFGFNLFSPKGTRWSDIYFTTIINTIFKGLKNVAFIFPNDKDDKLTTFLNTNITNLIWLLWNFGYIVVDIDKNGNYYIPDYAKLKKDSKGNILNYECVYYSDTYRFKNKTDFQIIQNTLNELGSYKDAIQHLTTNLGAIGILSGNNLPINPTEKEEFQNNLKSRYGINSDKNNILITTMPLKFDVMKFPVNELELSEKVKECYTLICNYFQVPIDLIFGQSTYANQEQAVKNFYSNCISPLSEIVLEVGKHLIKMQYDILIPSDRLSFRIDNVPEIKESVRTVDTEYIDNLTNNISMLKNLGLPTDKLEKVLMTYINSTE